MDGLRMVSWGDADTELVLDVWHRAFGQARFFCNEREFVFRISERQFRERIQDHPSFNPEGAIIAKVEEKVVGFALAVAPADISHGFLSVLAVDPAHQRAGIGSMLLDRAEAFLRTGGKREIRVTHEDNPLWFSLGTDMASPGHRFLLNRGYRSTAPQLVMQMDCSAFEWRGEVSEFMEANQARGIHFGLCGQGHRESLHELAPGIESALTGTPPYPVFVATDGPKVVGVSGPVSTRKGGAAGFSGVVTHPDYYRRKIGTVLFNLMCAEFKKEGAAFSNLYTGLKHHAQEIYFRVGYKVSYVMDEGVTKQLG